MELDKYLNQIQEDQIQEFEPITTTIAIGSTLVIANLITLLLASSELEKLFKVNKPLTKRLNNILGTTKWIVHLVRDSSPNAFSMGKGKHVFVTTGLQKIITKRELDAVLLHEVYHSKALHTYKNLAYKYPLFYLIVAAAISLPFTGGVPILGILAFILMMKVHGIPYEITLGRHHEKKADEYAVRLGYGSELISVLKKTEKIYLKQMAKHECGRICKIVEKIEDVIDEHPSTKKRIKDILKKSDKLSKAVKSMSFRKIRDFVMKG
jgi:Zn-dependent protease with chaperone function